MKVLIIKTSSLGDIIHALPVLDYLHQVSPGISIDWVVEEQFSDLLSGNPRINRLHLIRTRAWRRKLLDSATAREIGALRQLLREQHYDLVFDIQGNFKSGIIALATGSRERFGFNYPHLQEKPSGLFTRHKVDMRPEDDHAGGRYLRIVSAGFQRDYRGMELTSDIFTGDAENLAADQLISSCGKPVVLFHNGTTWQTKFWSVAGWTRLGALIRDRYPDATILLSWGNESERTTAKEIADAIGDQARVLDKYPLKGITALLKRVDLVIGGDTGLIHLAAAVGTATVSYYRASDGSVSGPRGREHVVVQSPLSCTRCQRTSCSRDDECRGSITPQAVFSGVEKIMTEKLRSGVER